MRKKSNNPENQPSSSPSEENITVSRNNKQSRKQTDKRQESNILHKQPTPEENEYRTPPQKRNKMDINNSDENALKVKVISV